MSRPSRILLPVQPWFIYTTLIFAFAVSLMPKSISPWLPDWTALVLCFWCVREPRFVGMGWGFFLGILTDVADGVIFGQHAIAFVLLAYLGNDLSRRFAWFTLRSQALQVAPLLFFCEGIQIILRMFAGGAFPGVEFLIAPLLASILWPVFSVLLLFPQHQPIEKNPDRPISPQ